MSIGRRIVPLVSDRAIAVALFLGTLLPLCYGLADRPPFLYNWEEYTVGQLVPALADPWPAILGSFRLSEGLMTDSGRTPLLMAPLLLATRLGGENLWTLRLFPALFTALAVPLVYSLGSETYGRRVGLMAAALTMVSASFVFYARTATNVGPSLVPAAATMLALGRWQRKPTYRTCACLAALFLAGTYFYATIRFLPLIAVPLVALVWRERGGRLIWPQAALMFGPLLLFLAVQTPGGPPLVGSVGEYYAGRGEHVGAALVRGEVGTLGPLLLANAARYLNLFLSAATAPVTTDYWNAAGRLYQPLLTVFFLVGLALALRDWRRPAGRTLLLFFFGTSLPIVLTNNLHVGRLLLSLLPLLVLAARGVVFCLDGVARLWRERPSRSWFIRGFALTGAFAFAAQWGALREAPTATPYAGLLLPAAVAWLASVPLVRWPAGYAACLTLALAIVAVGAAGEMATTVPAHHPWVVSQALGALPGDGDVLLVSWRESGELAEMETNVLSFYLHDRFAVAAGLPTSWQSDPLQRRLYVVAGFAQHQADLPAILPAHVRVVADRALGEDALRELRRLYGERLQTAG